MSGLQPQAIERTRRWLIRALIACLAVALMGSTAMLHERFQAFPYHWF